MKRLAVIPARSGSKGLPDKNILEVAGHPLMEYTITAAIKSKCFDEIMVSTDSAKYAEIAVACGAKVPFLRSDTTSGDAAGSWDVVREILRNYKERGIVFDIVALLQPTSPLRTEEDIEGAFKILNREYVHSVVSVTEVEHPVQWCFPLTDDLSLEEFAKSPYNQMRRQELEKHYRENGAIYIVDAKKIEDTTYNLYQDFCYAYIMPKERSIDIDTKNDLRMFEVYVNEKNMSV